jgi:hypothetical protein
VTDILTAQCYDVTVTDALVLNKQEYPFFSRGIVVYLVNITAQYNLANPVTVNQDFG